MFKDERNTLRNQFFTAWEKHLKKSPIEPLEAQIISVIVDHPEYHEFFSARENQHQEISGDTNPFLHLSLHLALRDQIQTNRPVGIKTIFQTLYRKHACHLQAEHIMMACLEKILWKAQQSNQPPDEKEYLHDLTYITRQ